MDHPSMHRRRINRKAEPSVFLTSRQLAELLGDGEVGARALECLEILDYLRDHGEHAQFTGRLATLGLWIWQARLNWWKQQIQYKKRFLKTATAFSHAVKKRDGYQADIDALAAGCPNAIQRAKNQASTAYRRLEAVGLARVNRKRGKKGRLHVDIRSHIDVLRLDPEKSEVDGLPVEYDSERRRNLPWDEKAGTFRKPGVRYEVRKQRERQWDIPEVIAQRLTKELSPKGMKKPTA